MNIDKLDESNFLLYAAKHYENPQCYDTVEFYDDLKRFKYIKRLFNRYAEEGDLKERLILNHIIVLINVFGPEPTAKMLFLKCKGLEEYLKPFLLFLNILPEKIENLGIENRTIYTMEIKMDMNILQELRKI
jgi:hypothetical protein